MLGTYFYNQAIKKTVVGFGTLFNNLVIEDVNPQDPTEVLSKQKVPLGYGPKEKFLVRLEENPDLAKVGTTFPRMYFEMTGINYGAGRKTSPIQKYKKVIDDNNNEVKVQYVPVPYDIDFTLGILARNQDDGLQILEQILPYFQPQFNITINFIPDMDERKDVSIFLNNINYSDEWAGNFKERRIIEWTLNFTAKTYVYGPFTTSDIIRKISVYETIGDFSVADRSTKLTYTPKALTDTTSDPNGPSAGAPDGVIDAFDDAAIGPADDFGFSGEIDTFF